MTPKERVSEALKKDETQKKTNHNTEKAHEQKEELLQMSEISIWLDNYDDIFSDFDPRPYSQRALSDDFLNEAKKASYEKTSGRVELKFLIPKDVQNLEEEKTIKRRLHEHFKRRVEDIDKEVKRLVRKGATVALLGMFSMMVAIYIYTYLEPLLIFNFIIVVLEPTGWFMAWYGFDSVFYQAEEEKEDLEFYKKMIKCQITFLQY